MSARAAPRQREICEIGNDLNVPRLTRRPDRLHSLLHPYLTLHVMMYSAQKLNVFLIFELIKNDSFGFLRWIMKLYNIIISNRFLNQHF